MAVYSKFPIRGVLEKFCSADPFFTKNQLIDLKKLYFPGCKLLFDIVTILNEVFFISIDELVDACGVPQWVHFWRSTALVFVALTNLSHLESLYPKQFTADSVITFYVVHTLSIHINDGEAIAKIHLCQS